MKKLKRILTFASTLVLSTSSLAIISAPTAFAAACSWDGSASDNDLTNGVNWTGCTGAGAGADLAPATVDTVDFPAAVAHVSPLTGALDVSGITFSGDYSAVSGYTIGTVGNALTIEGSGSITNTGTGAGADPIIASNVTFNGTGGTSPNIYNATNSSATMNFTGTVAVASGVTLGVSAILGTVDNVIDFQGAISGAGAVTVTAGKVKYSAANTYAGITTVGGYLLLTGASTLGSTAGKTVVSSGGTLEIAASSVGSFTGELFELSGRGVATGGSSVSDAASAIVANKTVTLSGVTLLADTAVCAVGGAVTLTLTATGAVDVDTATNALYKSASVACDGASKNNATNLVVDPGAGAGGLVDVTIPASGTFTISNGEVGTLSSTTTTDLTVATGGVLMGSGGVGTLSVQSGGTVAPGLSPGCITSAGSITLASGSNYDAEILNTTACTGYDQLVMTAGTLTVTGAVLNVTHLTGFVVAQGNIFRIVDNQGANPVTGTFSGLAEGATIVVGTVTYTISYVGGTGNDITLTATTVTTPPATPAAAAAATPAAPNTGFGAMASSPASVMFATTTVAGAILALARKYNMLKGIK